MTNLLKIPDSGLRTAGMTKSTGYFMDRLYLRTFSYRIK
jgi:hypothetical protein